MPLRHSPAAGCLFQQPLNRRDLPRIPLAHAGNPGKSFDADIQIVLISLCEDSFCRTSPPTNNWSFACLPVSFILSK